MFKKCQSKCQADKHLWIRNDIFYYMVELPRKNGKRRYLCKSLHTTNYYEAQEKIKNMEEELYKKDIKDLNFRLLLLKVRVALSSLKCEIQTIKKQEKGKIITYQQKKITADNDPKHIENFLLNLKNLCIYLENNKNLTDEDLKAIQEIISVEIDKKFNELFNLYKPNYSSPGSNHTIKEIMESMFKKAGNVKNVEKNRRMLIIKMLKNVGLTIDDNYSKFYNHDIIQKMCDNIIAMNVTSSVKRNHTREIKNLIIHANYIDPDTYKTNLLNIIPELKKTQKSERNPHWPYTDNELKQIFNIKNDYFNKRPDVFWTTLIGMFFGARSNAAITLQYADIITVDGIDCVKFQNTHPLKQLKNSATRRTVPIPKQLLDIGFVNYINTQKVKLKAKETDFIFSQCQTSGGEYNNKFMTRGFIKYINDIGITKNNPHKLDFHSLRKNANQRLEEFGVTETFINDIIGWEGKGTRQQSYSNHDLIKIKEQADKLQYDFLQSEFDYWRDVMSKK